MTTPRPRESEPAESRDAISADADDWIRQFIKHLELHFLDASRNLPPEASVSEFQVTTARAMLATFMDSGMEFLDPGGSCGCALWLWPKIATRACTSSSLGFRRICPISAN